MAEYLTGCWARTTPARSAVRNNLTVAYRAAGRAAEAIPLHEQALADRERLLGPDHPSTLRSRGNLALVYKEGPPRHAGLAEQPRRGLPGRRAGPDNALHARFLDQIS